jgi:nucleoside 2-deoxyribosyltransferase
MADKINFLSEEFDCQYRNGVWGTDIMDLSCPYFSFWISQKAFDFYDKKIEQKHIYLSIINELCLKDKNTSFFCLDNENRNFSIVLSDIRTIYSMDRVFDYFPKTFLQKQVKSLINLSRINPDYGAEINKTIFYTFYSKNTDEENLIINSLIEKRYISAQKIDLRPISYRNILIQENGWNIIENEIDKVVENQAFIAMWFDPKMDRAYDAISKTLDELHILQIRIDKKEHNNQITDEILYSIRKSGFLICDVTEQRNGVYFEGGYAMGLGKPVIWTCKEDDLGNVHFDTRQFNHVVWKDEDDLAARVNKRIKGTIL